MEVPSGSIAIDSESSVASLRTQLPSGCNRISAFLASTRRGEVASPSCHRESSADNETGRSPRWEAGPLQRWRRVRSGGAAALQHEHDQRDRSRGDQRHRQTSTNTSLLCYSGTQGRSITPRTSTFPSGATFTLYSWWRGAPGFRRQSRRPAIIANRRTVPSSRSMCRHACTMRNANS